MAVGSAYAHLKSHLPTIGLHLNYSKSDVCHDVSDVLPDELSSLQEIHGHATRSYLGAPLHPGESTAMLSTVHKLQQVCAALKRMAPQYPQQALTMLRTCAWPRRI